MANKRTRRTKLQKADDTRKIVQLRLAGAQLEEISVVIGISTSQVSRDLSNAIKNMPQERAEELRSIEAMRLDRLLRSVWKNAVDGDLKAVDRALRISERRAKMFGLDTLTVSAGSDLKEAIAEQFKALVDLPDSEEF